MAYSLEQENAIRRVNDMEQAFDFLQNAWKEAPDSFRTNAEVRETMKRVLTYYESPDWLGDYQRDEQGMFPPELKRGILSEDGFYNFLSDVEAFLSKEKD